jgi:EmrB/QacA subfamily drug resistance transporter
VKLPFQGIPLIPAVLSVALFIESMDATMISTALPVIARDMQTTPASLKFALLSYYVALAIFVPVGGWAADRFGSLNLLRGAMGLFVAGSLACAISENLASFVAARFLQGAGGALMAPVARVILFRITPRQDFISATSWFTVPTVIAPMIGPPLGGLLATFFGWQWIFLVNIPIAAVGILLVTRFLPNLASRAERPFDWVGFGTLATALACLALGISLPSQSGVPFWIGPLNLGLAALAGILHIHHARRSVAPILDLSIFREPTFRVSTIGIALLYIGCSAMPFLTALMLQVGFGMTAFHAGLVTLASASGALIAKGLVGRIFSKVGFRTGMTVSAILVAAGIAAKSTLMPATPIFILLALLLVNGVMRSICFTGAAVLAVADMPHDKLGDAAAASLVMRQTCSGLSVAMAGTVIGLSASAHGGMGRLHDFQNAMLVSSLVCASAVFAMARLRPQSGEGTSRLDLTKN